jgi:hypothetical protein
MGLEAPPTDFFRSLLGVIDKSKWTQAARSRIGGCLQNLGWDWKQKREAGERVRRYYPLKSPGLERSKQLWAPAVTRGEPA